MTIYLSERDTISLLVAVQIFRNSFFVSTYLRLVLMIYVAPKFLQATV